MTGFTFEHEGHKYRVTTSWQHFRAVNQAIWRGDIMAVCELAHIYGIVKN